VHGDVRDSSQCTNCTRNRWACRFLGFPFQPTMHSVGDNYSRAGYPDFQWPPRDGYLLVTELQADDADDRKLGLAIAEWFEGLERVETLRKVPTSIAFDDLMSAPVKGKKGDKMVEVESADEDAGKGKGRGKKGARKARS
jgi:hypothetical protein